VDLIEVTKNTRMDFNWIDLELNALLTILATLLSPLIAVRVERSLEQHREERERKLIIFKTLMATRADRLSLDHVQALNMIEIEFSGKGQKDREVLKAWKAYHDSLCKNSSHEFRVERFIDLLHVMSKCFKYEFDRTDLKNTWYSPQLHGLRQEEDEQLRKCLLEIATGNRSIPVAVTNWRDLEEEEQEIGEQQARLSLSEKKEAN
jgi:hypothetical protein